MAEHVAPAIDPRRRRLMLIALLLGALVTMLNTSVASVALPTIVSDLGADGIQIHFIADGFSIALTACVLLTGALGDAYGRKRMFIIGLVLMIPAAVMASRSTSANELIFWLMASGVATAFLFPTTLSAITEIFTTKQERAQAVALWAGTAAAGAAIAPIISGWMLEHYAWGAVFLVSVPLALLTLVLGIVVLDPMVHPHPHPVDWLGGVLSIIALSTLITLVILAPVDGWQGPVPLLTAVSLVAMIAFVIRQLRIAHPLIDLRVFRNKPLLGGALIITILFTAMSGIMFLTAQYTQSVLGYSTLQAGVATLPLTIAVFIASPVSARWVMRMGTRRTVIIGAALVALGALSCRWWSAESPYLLLFITFVLFGVGLGLAMTPSTSAILDTLPPEQAGVASAVNDVTRDFGEAFGIALNGAVAGVVYASIIDTAYGSLTPEQRTSIPDTIYREVRGSLAGALSAAKAHPGPEADAVVTIARDAFVNGQATAAAIGVVLGLLCLVFAYLLLPDKSTTS